MKRFGLFWGMMGIVAIMLQSCENKDDVYEKTYSFEKNILTNKDVMRYDFDNPADTFQLYNIELSILHEPQVAISQLPLLLGYRSPNGESISVPIAIPLYDKSFKPVGTIRPDSLVELKQTLFYANSLRTGVNTFEIAMDSHQDSLFGVVSFTLSIERAN